MVYLQISVENTLMAELSALKKKNCHKIFVL